LNGFNRRVSRIVGGDCYHVYPRIDVHYFFKEGGAANIRRWGTDEDELRAERKECLEPNLRIGCAKHMNSCLFQGSSNHIQAILVALDDQYRKHA